MFEGTLSYLHIGFSAVMLILMLTESPLVHVLYFILQLCISDDVTTAIQLFLLQCAYLADSEIR